MGLEYNIMRKQMFVALSPKNNLIYPTRET